MNRGPTAAELIAESLRRHGVELTFGQSLPTMVQLANSDVGIRQIAYRTENAGASMADGYARLSGKIGVVTAQNGPAATLLVPGLAEALKSSTPVLALVQEVPRDLTDRNAFQEIDHIALFSGCAKWTRRVERAERMIDYIDMAVTAATSGRGGPAVLLLPSDLLLEQIDKPQMTRGQSLGKFPLDRPVADLDVVDRAADVLASARNPIVVAGGGVHLSGAHQELAALQMDAKLPVATTTMGKGAVDETHPLSMGVVGNSMGHRGRTQHMRKLIADADVVLLVGTRTDQNATDSWSLFSTGTAFIHVDVDGQEIGRNYEALRLVGDARATLGLLLRQIRKRNLSTRVTATERVRTLIASALRLHAQDIADVANSDEVPARPERLMAELQRHLTEDDIVVGDASYSSVWISNYLEARRPGTRFITPRGLAGLGWGFPMAVGAKLARPEAQVFCVSGDGGFGHCWQELETAARTGVKIVLTVLNNGVLGFQKDAEDVKFGRHTDACRMTKVDHAAIARACGCQGITVRTPREYGDALAAAIASDVTTLIDVDTDPEAYPPLTLFDGKLEEFRAHRP